MGSAMARGKTLDLEVFGWLGFGGLVVVVVCGGCLGGVGRGEGRFSGYRW